jgi:hypothetical protein
LDTTPPVELSVTPMLSNDGGSDTLSVTVVYNEAMWGGNLTIMFSPDVTLPPVALMFSGATWTSSTTYVAEYYVFYPGIDLSNITIDVTGGRDVAGNPELPIIHPGSIDTSNPAPASLADAVLSSGALNLSVGSLATSLNNQQSASNPIDQALAFTGTWLDI